MKFLVAAAMVVLAPVNARAQDTRNVELDVSNQNLNATYRALIRRLAPADQAALKSAQLLWMKFRDADCTAMGGDRRDCLIQRTDEREEQLRNSTYFDAQGKLISLPAPPSPFRG